MREVEVKILDIDVESVRKKLLDLGAKKVFEGEVDFKMFDFQDGSIEHKREHLRVRKIGDKVEIVHKSRPEAVEGYKIIKETETYVEDFETMCQILENIGLTCFEHLQKKRESYKLPKGKVELDFYDGIPTFLEVETQKEEDLKEIVEQLGYTMKDTFPHSIRKIVKIYGKTIEDISPK